MDRPRVLNHETQSIRCKRRSLNKVFFWLLWFIVVSTEQLVAGAGEQPHTRRSTRRQTHGRSSHRALHENVQHPFAAEKRTARLLRGTL
jgi:hypothetical protein